MIVRVEEEYDGFTIVVVNNNRDTVIKRWHFDQEDSVEGLVEVFEWLDWKSEYEEVY